MNKRVGDRCSIALAIISIVAGCSSVEPPVDAISKAELAVTQATQSKAVQYAGEELNAARTKLDRAHRALDAERYIEARRMAEQAQAEALLAEAKAEAEGEQRRLDELQGSIEVLETQVLNPQ